MMGVGGRRNTEELNKPLNTPEDFRILLAEKALSELDKLFNNLRLQRRKEYQRRLRALAGEMQNIKYSYLSPKDLVDFSGFKNLVKEAEEIKKDVKSLERDFFTVQSLYWLDYLSNLPELILRGEISKPSQAIRFSRGEIVSRNKINGLWLCMVDCGFKLSVITNNENFKPGKMAVVALLPPRTFGKHISEGMFVSLTEGEKGEVNPEEIGEVAEVDSILFEILI